MTIRSLKHRILQLRVVTCMFTVLGFIALYKFVLDFGTYQYPYIPEEKIRLELYRRTTPYLIKNKTLCKYDEILNSTESTGSWITTVNRELRPENNNYFSSTGIVLGSYTPECHPAFSVAILVTHRNRQEHLNIFLPYMHNFLRKQNIHYKIYVIEQRDEKPWNKGILYNIGARRAIADKFPCLIMHDVDLLPLDRSNLYACTHQPRHMSACIDNFRFVLPYRHLVGGVLAMRADQYVKVDGFSNRFKNWGGEDDDLHARIRAHNLDIVRFQPTRARYFMMMHQKAPRNAARWRIMSENHRNATAGSTEQVVHHDCSEAVILAHRLSASPGRLETLLEYGRRIYWPNCVFKDIHLVNN